MKLARYLFLACAVFSSGVHSSHATADVAAKVDKNFVDWSGWSSYYNYYYNDYLYPIATYRVNAYRSAYDRALMRNALSEARNYWLQLGQANGDLLRLQRRTRELEHLIERIENSGRALDSLVNGKVTTSTNIALNYLMRALGGNIVTFGAQSVPELKESNFILRSPYSTRYDQASGEMIRIENHLERFEGGNMLQFIAWIRARPYDLSPGSVAHFVMLQVRTDLASAGYSWLSEIMANREAIQNGYASMWGAMYGAGGLDGLPAREPPRDGD
jgi:hypothetical protein